MQKTLLKDICHKMLRFKLKILLLSTFWLFSITPAHTLRILFFLNFEGPSHLNFHEMIMKSLLEAGHHVTYVSSFKPPNYLANFPNTSKHLQIDKDNSLHRMKPVAHPNKGWLSWLKVAYQTLDVLETDCYKVMSLENLKTIRNYDVMFIEMLPMYQCYLPIAKKMGIPIIGTMSLRSYLITDMEVGNPRNPAIFPIEFSMGHMKMSFFERLQNLIDYVALQIIYRDERKRLETFYQTLLPNQNTYGVNTISLVFFNNHLSIFSRPMVPNAINIGGINVKSAILMPLPMLLEKFIKEAKHGVIYFSLGSMASSEGLDLQIRTVLVKSFSQIPQRVIWKYDGEIDGLPENILLSKWLPQKEILAHENVIAFITHCGLGSIYETINFGKPIIMVPVFADQVSNARIMIDLEVGLYLDIMDLNEKLLLKIINEVVNNKKYRNNMAELSKKFKDEPLSPTQLVVYWTEYVIRYNGAPHLRSVGADMPLYQYLLLDIIVFIIISIILIYFITYSIIKRISIIIFNAKQKPVSIKNKIK